MASEGNWGNKRAWCCDGWCWLAGRERERDSHWSLPASLLYIMKWLSNPVRGRENNTVDDSQSAGSNSDGNTGRCPSSSRQPTPIQNGLG